MNTSDEMAPTVHHRCPESPTPLFRPRSVAVIGASRDSLGGRVLDDLLHASFEGPVYPVHPTAHAVGSVRVYRSVIDVPDDVDLAIVAVPARVVPEVVEQCAEKGVRAHDLTRTLER